MPLSKNFSIANRYFIMFLILLSVFLEILAIIFKMREIFNLNFALMFNIFSFIILFLFSVLWLKNKLDFDPQNETHKNGIFSRPLLVINAIFFSLFYFLTFILLFLQESIPTTYFDLEKLIIIIFLTIPNVLIIYQLNLVFKQQTRPNAYIFKFLLRKIERFSNDYETVFSLKVLIFGVVFILPLILGYIITNDIITDYLIVSLLLNLLIGSYWVGYGLYKYFVWVWGASNSITNTSDNDNSMLYNFKVLLNLQYSENRSILFAFFFLLYTIFLLVLVIISNIIPSFQVNDTTEQLLLLIYFCSLYIVILQITGNRTESQPWFSNTFTIYSFTIPLFLTIIFNDLIAKNANSTFEIIFPATNSINWFFILGLAFSTILIIKANNDHLTKSLWRDPYESNQILSSLKLSITNPSANQLSLLQKISNALDDKDTIIKLIGIYKSLIESESHFLKDNQIKSVIQFITNQLLLSADIEIFEPLFELTHSVLDDYPENAKILFKPNLEILKNTNSIVKIQALNVMGHILQLENNLELLDDLYSELERNFITSDEKLKRLVLDAFSYIILNFIDYNGKIQNFLVEKLEYETVGIATIMYSLLEKIYQNKGDSYLIDLTKSKLEQLDTPAKIGAVNFVKNNFPDQPQNDEIFVNLLLNNLKDIDNETGVRSSIINTFNELIKNNKIQKSLLVEMKNYINDVDPDVKTAIIQLFVDHYMIKNVNFTDFEFIITEGYNDQDYIVRLVVLQSLKTVGSVEKQISAKFNDLLKKAKFDESQPIRDIATELSEN